MKDIYSPLEIDEEWDNLAPVAEGTATATNPSTDVANNQPLPGLPSTNLLAPEEVTYNDSAPDSAYNAAEALIDNSEQDTKPDTAAAVNSGDTFTSGLVKITPDKPTSDKPAPETPITGTPHEIKGVPIKVMGGETSEETPDSNDTLSDPIDRSNGGTSSPEVPVIAPYIAPFKPEEMLKGKASDDAIGTGTITPGTIKASDDDGGESSDDNVENSENATADDTDDTESDTARSSSETKADKPKAPTSAGDDELAGILDKWDQSNKEIADMLKAAREEIEANVLRMSDQKTNLEADLEQQIADLDEGIANENARLAKIETNLAKLPSDEA
ncbi:hypothetical protein EXS66_03015, partial [Candidatus Saccharibacteria bacterium]|nr:hypothetical protein [Candidatus Saccharibacteria bacterium]